MNYIELWGLAIPQNRITKMVTIKNEYLTKYSQGLIMTTLDSYCINFAIILLPGWSLYRYSIDSCITKRGLVKSRWYIILYRESESVSVTLFCKSNCVNLHLNVLAHITFWTSLYYSMNQSNPLVDNLNQWFTPSDEIDDYFGVALDQ